MRVPDEGGRGLDEGGWVLDQSEERGLARGRAPDEGGRVPDEGELRTWAFDGCPGLGPSTGGPRTRCLNEGSASPYLPSSDVVLGVCTETNSCR